MKWRDEHVAIKELNHVVYLRSTRSWKTRWGGGVLDRHVRQMTSRHGGTGRLIARGDRSFPVEHMLPWVPPVPRDRSRAQTQAPAPPHPLRTCPPLSRFFLTVTSVSFANPPLKLFFHFFNSNYCFLIFLLFKYLIITNNLFIC